VTQLRRATADDAECVAVVFVNTQIRHLPFLPRPPLEKIAPWMRETLLPAGNTWVLEDGDLLLAMLTLSPAADPVHWIHHLYVAEDQVGRGFGSVLLDFALAGPQRLDRAVRLWTFQANSGARRFYERRGFVPIEFTDGRNNIERCPDVLYGLPAVGLTR
jgi:GNAT superfamily N-acetyltransferase